MKQKQNSLDISQGLEEKNFPLFLKFEENSE